MKMKFEPFSYGKDLKCIFFTLSVFPEVALGTSGMFPPSNPRLILNISIRAPDSHKSTYSHLVRYPYEFGY